MSGTQPTPFPPPGTPITDNSGRLTSSWFSFFQALFIRTGGGTGISLAAVEATANTALSNSTAAVTTANSANATAIAADATAGAANTTANTASAAAADAETVALMVTETPDATQLAQDAEIIALMTVEA